MLPMYEGKIDRVVIVTDAWQPQINGVVRTLHTTMQVLRDMGIAVYMITPQDFNTLPCPTYPSIPLSLLPGEKVRKRIVSLGPNALHIATEGPLGWAARNFAVEMGIPFSTAYHTRFPEYIHARFSVPLRFTYAYLRIFHRFSHSIMAPTPMVKRDLEAHKFPNVVLWSRGVDLGEFQPPTAGIRSTRGRGDWPIFLYAGRVAVEKNIEAFLKLDLPGKWVVGDGPALASLQEAYPDAVYWGFRNHTELAQLYQQANVFVFPSRTDTFGLVLLEAMATGLPVAAYPVSGPIDVIGTSSAGVLDEDLRTACLKALEIDPARPREHAEKYSWQAATQMFYNNLRYIPPCVFAKAVRDWANVRWMDDSADLIGILPPSLSELLMHNNTNACSASHTALHSPSKHNISSTLLPIQATLPDFISTLASLRDQQPRSVLLWSCLTVLLMALVSRFFMVRNTRRRLCKHHNLSSSSCLGLTRQLSATSVTSTISSANSSLDDSYWWLSSSPRGHGGSSRFTLPSKAASIGSEQNEHTEEAWLPDLQEEPTTVR